MVGGLRDVITCAEFQIEIFMGYDFTGGRIFDFCIDFSMGLTTVQRYCAACDTLAVTFTIVRSKLVHSFIQFSSRLVPPMNVAQIKITKKYSMLKKLKKKNVPAYSENR